MGNAWKHFCTITKHKNLVMTGCFKVGLYKQGLLHDLSKYSLTEFLVGVKYYRGYMSPNNAERAATGVSLAWLHHKGRNKHHLEYWIDYEAKEGKDEEAHKGMCGMKMPVRYVAEMFIDRVSASKNYKGNEYTDDCPLLYYQKGKGAYMIHPDTEAMLEFLLTMLAKKGEKETFSFIKNDLLKGKVLYEKTELNKRRDAL